MTVSECNKPLQVCWISLGSGMKFSFLCPLIVEIEDFEIYVFLIVVH
jgi:hypothetical protein